MAKGIYVCCVGVRSGTMRLADCDKELANVDQGQYKPSLNRFPVTE